VERVAEGLWKVPDDLAERGRRYDAQRLGGVAVELKSHLPIERQARVIGATWLDQQLIGGGRAGRPGLWRRGQAGDAAARRLPGRTGAGRAARAARDPGAQPAGHAAQSGTGAGREDIAAETGLEHRPVADGQRVAGIYRRSVMLASGRYAMLDDGMGFSLVPWKPVIEQRLGQQHRRDCAAAVCHGRLDGNEVLGLDRGRRLSYRVKVSSSVLALASVLR
jgi:hypothetical protein